MPGSCRGRDVTIQDVFEAVGSVSAGSMTPEELGELERSACPGPGSCAGMYTANTMAAAGEALGPSLPGSASPPAVDQRRGDLARPSREAAGLPPPRGLPPPPKPTRE